MRVGTADAPGGPEAAEASACAPRCAVTPELGLAPLATDPDAFCASAEALLATMPRNGGPGPDAAAAIEHWRLFFDFGWWEGHLAEVEFAEGKGGFRPAALGPGDVSVEIVGEPDGDGIPDLNDGDRFGDRYADPWGAGGASGGSAGLAEPGLLTSSLEGAGGGNAPFLGRSSLLDAGGSAPRFQAGGGSSPSSSAASSAAAAVDAGGGSARSGTLSGPRPPLPRNDDGDGGEDGGGGNGPAPPSVGRLSFSLFRESDPPGWNPDAPTRHDALWRDPVVLAETAAGPVAARPGGTLTVTDSQLFSDLRFASGARVGAEDQTAVAVTWDASGSFALLAQELAWGTIGNLSVTEFTGDRLELENWLDVFVTLNASRPLTLIVEGAQRGEVVVGGSAGTSVTVGMDNSGDGTTAHFLVVTGRAGDAVFLRGSEREDPAGTYEGSGTTTVIFTGAGDDVVFGWGSDDTVDAGSGRDVFVLRGLRDGYSITTDGVWTVIRDLDPSDGDDGTDRLLNVEVLRFADGGEVVLGAGGGPGDGGDGGRAARRGRSSCGPCPDRPARADGPDRRCDAARQRRRGRGAHACDRLDAACVRPRRQHRRDRRGQLPLHPAASVPGRGHDHLHHRRRPRPRGHRNADGHRQHPARTPRRRPADRDSDGAAADRPRRAAGQRPRRRRQHALGLVGRRGLRARRQHHRGRRGPVRPTHRLPASSASTPSPTR